MADGNRIKKLGVVIPWNSMMIWTACMRNMLNWERPEGLEIEFFFGDGWCPAQRHNTGTQQALMWQADLIMYWGGDQIAERDILIKLYGHIQAGWDMATGMIPCRGVVGRDQIPYDSFGHKEKSKEAQPMIMLPFHSPKLWDLIRKEDGCQEIHTTGTGLLMMKTKVFYKMERPWFRELISPAELNFGRQCAMDTTFVRLCTRDFGMRLWLDTTIEAIHLDGFAIDDTFKERFKDKTGQPLWSSIREPFKERNY